MKLFAPFAAAAVLFSTFATAQAEIPVVSVREIAMPNSDSLAKGKLFSDYIRDTVIVRASVVVPVHVNAETGDERRILGGIGGNTWVAYVRDLDINATDNVGFALIQFDTTDDASFSAIKTGDVIEAKVVVVLSGNQNSGRATWYGAILGSETEPAVKIIENKPLSITPVSVSVTDFYNQNLQLTTEKLSFGAKHLRSLVEFSDLIYFQSGGEAFIANNDGIVVPINDLSGYFTSRNHRLAESDLPILYNGQKIPKIRGYISPGQVNGQNFPFTIAPVFPGDVEYGAAPPEFLNLYRSYDNIFPKPDEEAMFTATISAADAMLNEDLTLLHYSTDGKEYSSVKFIDDGFSHSASLPKFPNNSIVRYYATCTDEKGVSNRFPLFGTYTFRVTDKPAKIADILNPDYLDANTIMPISNFYATFEATVTMDTADRRGGGGGYQLIIQDDTKPYSAMSATTFSADAPLWSAKRNDLIRVRGKLRQQPGGIFQLAEVSDVEIVSNNSPISSVYLDASTWKNGNTFTQEMERYRNMLVEVQNVKIIDLKDKDGRNNGRFTIVQRPETNPDRSIHIETMETNIPYATSDSLATLLNRQALVADHNFTFIRGLLSSDQRYYKVIPRFDGDFGMLTQVNENTNEKSAWCSPNPTNGALSIFSQSAQSWKVFSMQGEIVQQGIFNAGKSFVEMPSWCTNGTYILAVESLNGTSVSEKIILWR